MSAMQIMGGQLGKCMINFVILNRHRDFKRGLSIGA